MGVAGSSACIRGSVLVARLNLVRRRGGEESVQRVLQRLRAEERALLEGKLQTGAWFPLWVGSRLGEAIAAVLFPGQQEQAYVEMGRASAEENLEGPQQVFIRPGEPHFLLSCSPQLYRLYYAVGARVYQRLGERSALLRTYGAQGVTAEDCLTIVGWHQRAIELSGGSNVRVSHPLCQAQGHERCEYLCEWD